MGAADVVPGVSGGTIAFISGIYAQLLHAIQAVNPDALRILFRQGFAAFWLRIDGTFLVVLISGILLSVVTFARLLSYVLAHFPLLVWGFFFGLIVGSVIYIWRQIPVRGLACWCLLLLGAGAVFSTAFASQAQIEPTPLNLFGAGMLAICAMILPGISGSFILLLLGMYPVILGAVAEPELSVLAIFAGGCVTGLLLFSRLLSWLLARFHNFTLATLTGFLVGSLAVVWPWKEAVVTPGEAIGAVTRTHLMLPSGYAQTVGESQWLAVLGLMAVGLLLVLILEYVGERRARL